MLRDAGQRGAVILGDVAVGADVGEQRLHRRAGQVDAVARLHIAAFGVAGGGVLQHLGTVQKFPALVLTHLDKGFVVLIYLRLGQALVGVLLPDGWNRVDDNIHAGVGGHDGLNAGLVVLDEIRRLVTGVQVIGAEGQQHPARLQLGHGLRHRDVAGRGAQLHAGKAGQRFRAHAHRADGVVIAAIVKHTVHTRRVAVPQKEGFFYVAVACVGGGGQNRGIVGLRVNGVLLFVVAAFRHHRATVRGGAACAGIKRANQRQRNRNADQQHHAAQGQHQIHLAARIQRALLFCFGFACHEKSFRPENHLQNI